MPHLPALYFRFTLRSTLFLSSLVLATKEAETKPNIVVFLADDLGWGDTSPYGNTEIKTPNLAKLAAQGVNFNQCYSACGVSSPWKEETNLAGTMPDKAKEMQAALFKLWNEIETEGPNEWWLKDSESKSKSGGPNY